MYAKICCINGNHGVCVGRGGEPIPLDYLTVITDTHLPVLEDLLPSWSAFALPPSCMHVRWNISCNRIIRSNNIFTVRLTQQVCRRLVSPLALTQSKGYTAIVMSTKRYRWLTRSPENLVASAASSSFPVQVVPREHRRPTGRGSVVDSWC